MWHKLFTIKRSFCPWRYLKSGLCTFHIYLNALKISDTLHGKLLALYELLVVLTWKKNENLQHFSYSCHLGYFLMGNP